MSTQQIIGISIALATAAVVIVFTLLARRRRLRERAELLERLRGDGWQVEDRPPRKRRRECFEPFRHVRGLPRAHHGVRSLLRTTLEDREVRVLEYVYSESAGNSTRIVRSLAAATPCPPAWPHLELDREHFLHKVGAALGLRDMQVENPAFNDRWRIRTDDESFALCLLTPEVQSWLMALEGRETWSIGDGWIVCLRRDPLRRDALESIAARPGGLLALVPPELHHDAAAGETTKD